MNDLKCDSVRSSIVHWMMHIITERNDPCKKYLNDAIKSYMNHNDKRLVGILIRDTSPNKIDLQYAFERLKSDNKTHLDMWALYLPIPISSLPGKIGVA
ncbi:MAG: hypothetical protein OXC46_10230 [Thaumarchaeota archaeon]|nr:hypothetical protein [Nitrososphaerota archaeon]